MTIFTVDHELLEFRYAYANDRVIKLVTTCKFVQRGIASYPNETLTSYALKPTDTPSGTKQRLCVLFVQ